MDRDQIIKLVNNTLNNDFEVPLEELKPDSQLNEFGLDSLDYIDMISILENALNFRFPDREVFSSVRTVGDIYDLIEKITSSDRNAHPN